MKTIYDKIWNIRGLIDKAIITKDFELFDKAKLQLNEIFVNEEYLNTMATATVGVEYETEEQLNQDRLSNFAMLASQLIQAKNELMENEENEYYIQFSCCLQVVWFSRENIDVFVDLAKNSQTSKDEGYTCFKSMLINIEEILKIYRSNCFNDKTSINEIVSLHKIKNDICKTYKNTFGEELIVEGENNNEY